jgi:hypothetical protein
MKLKIMEIMRTVPNVVETVLPFVCSELSLSDISDGRVTVSSGVVAIKSTG